MKAFCSPLLTVCVLYMRLRSSEKSFLSKKVDSVVRPLQNHNPQFQKSCPFHQPCHHTCYAHNPPHHALAIQLPPRVENLRELHKATNKTLLILCNARSYPPHLFTLSTCHPLRAQHPFKISLLCSFNNPLTINFRGHSARTVFSLPSCEGVPHPIRTSMQRLCLRRRGGKRS